MVYGELAGHEVPSTSYETHRPLTRTDKHICNLTTPVGKHL